MWFLILVVTILSAIFLVYTAFPMVMMLKGAHNSGIEIPRGVMAVGYFWGVIGWFSDVVFNTFPAWFIFRTLDIRGLTFSDRIQQYTDMIGAGYDLDLDHDEVRKWARLMNYCDPNHIRNVPSTWEL